MHAIWRPFIAGLLRSLIELLRVTARPPTRRGLAPPPLRRASPPPLPSEFLSARPPGATRLANLQGCLPLLTSLVTLDLSENQLTDLREVLSVCSRMRYLKNLELMGAPAGWRGRTLTGATDEQGATIT